MDRRNEDLPSNPGGLQTGGRGLDLGRGPGLGRDPGLELDLKPDHDPGPGLGRGLVRDPCIVLGIIDGLEDPGNLKKKKILKMKIQSF